MKISPVPEKLKRELPHLVKFWPFIQLLNLGSDRGKVLISTGFMEEQLKDVLVAFMIEGQTGELFGGGNAPLGTLSARIATCRALGLISATEEHDLTLIRKIRNAFAHSLEASFETAKIRDRCKELLMKAPDYVHPESGEVKMGPDSQFMTAAVALVLALVNRPVFVSNERRADKIWPN